MTSFVIQARAIAFALSFVVLAATSISCGSDLVVPSSPASQSAVSGTSPQTAAAGTAVATPPAVRVVDANGQPVTGVTVAFTISSGGGTIAGALPTTNSNGIATVTSWTLGSTVGINTLTATIGALAPVTFTATGIFGVPSQITKTSPDPQTAVVGAAVAAPLSVTVRDAGGNAITGVAVTFTVMVGNGSVVSNVASSNSAGVATSGAWTLGTAAGLNAVTATVSGLPPVTFTATGTPAAPIRLDIAPTAASLLPGGTYQITLSAVDRYGNTSAATGAYASAAPGIATVSSAGLITGVSVGSTSITVTSGTLSGIVSVTVTSAVLGVNGRPWAIRVSSANTLAVAQRDLNSITFVDATGIGARVTAALGESPADVAFTRSGTIAFVGLFDGTVKRVNVADGSAAGSVRPINSAYRLALSPDDTRLYVSTDGRLYAVNATTMSVIGFAPIPGALAGLAMSGNGQFLYVTSSIGRVQRVAAQTLVTDAYNTLIGGRPQDVAVTADGSEAIVANEDGWVDIVDGVTLESKQRIPIANAAPFGMALSPDDTQIWVTSPTTAQVFVINRTTRAIVRTIAVGGSPRRIAFTTDGRTALVSNDAGWVDMIR